MLYRNWSTDSNFDDNSNLMTVLSGRSSIPGARPPFAGFSSREFYQQVPPSGDQKQSKKRKATANPPQNMVKETPSDAKTALSDDIDVDMEVLLPSEMARWEQDHPVIKPSQFPGHKLRKSIVKKAQVGKV